MRQLGMMVEIVKEYGNEIPAIIREIKRKHVDSDERDKAGMIFSTVHKCKGMEYDTVQLVNDFISENKLKKLVPENKAEALNLARLNEEINLLYVAVTRSKNSIHIPSNIMVKDFPSSKHIHILNEIEEGVFREVELPEFKKTKKPKSARDKKGESKSYKLEEIRMKHAAAYKPWTVELDDELTIMYCEGIHIKDMAKHFGRTKGAIQSRIIKLELEEKYGF